MSASYCRLPGRGVLKIEGEDRIDFLQGLVTNDVSKATETEGVYGAFLTPQGKFLCDFFILAEGESILLEMESELLAGFKKKLTMYKLRSKVKLADVSEDYQSFVFFGGDVPVGNGIFADPRLSQAGYRGILKETPSGYEEVEFAAYDLHRLQLGLPDGSRDIQIEKSILLENGFNELNGVDWDKGCYMGQELTARTKYRALIKKRLFPVEISGELPEPGTDVQSGDKVVGTIHSGCAPYALATLRLDALELDLHANGSAIQVHQPDWMELPKQEAS